MTDHEKMILISKVKGGLSKSSGFYRSFATTKSCLFPFMIAFTIRLSQDKKIASLNDHELFWKVDRRLGPRKNVLTCAAQRAL